MAEWLGGGLQNHLRGFEPYSRLKERRKMNIKDIDLLTKERKEEISVSVNRLMRKRKIRRIKPNIISIIPRNKIHSPIPLTTYRQNIHESLSINPINESYTLYLVERILLILGYRYILSYTTVMY